jgi:hypothetical protein
MTASPSLSRSLYAIPVFGWIARDIARGPDNIWYALVILLTVLVLAVKTWGLVALALTAIVITFGVTAFLLALGYRSWQITGDDMVEDDIEDRFLMRRRAVDGPEAELGDGEPDTTEFEVGEGS